MAYSVANFGRGGVMGQARSTILFVIPDFCHRQLV